jgi:hypothetical protein
VYCVKNDAPTFQVTFGQTAICHRCRVDLATEVGLATHPEFRPLAFDYVADRSAPKYQANLKALESVAKLWGYGIHGDTASGWVDLEFKDLVTAASFVQVLPGGVAALAAVSGPVAMFRGKRVVITFPIPDDRDLFGVR